MYGVRSGSSNAPGAIVGEKNSFTQEDIAQKLGMDVRTLQNYKMLSEMIPELEELLDTDVYIFDCLHIIIHSIDNALQNDI